MDLTEILFEQIQTAMWHSRGNRLTWSHSVIRPVACSFGHCIYYLTYQAAVLTKNDDKKNMEVSELWMQTSVLVCQKNTLT